MESLPLDFKLKLLGRILSQSQKDSEQVQREQDQLSPPEGDQDRKDVVAIIMTKDRAFQLQECLRTLFNYCDGNFFQVHVLCNVEGRFKKSYDAVREKFPSIKFHLDTSSKEFAENLYALVAANSKNLLCFLVDDMIFYRQFSLSSIVDVMKDSKILGYHLALHPNVTFCQPSGKKAIVPSDMSLIASGARDSMRFRRILGTEDWNYPWNLCGGIYRGSDSLAVLKCIESKSGRLAFGHPNHFEVNGNIAISSAKLDEKRPYSACPKHGLSSVITINRVQDIYKNPIYIPEKIFTSPTNEESVVDCKRSVHGSEKFETESSEHESISLKPGSVDYMDKLFWRGDSLDSDAYAKLKPISVHISQMQIKSVPQNSPST
mmetsp:Transcript_25090/g.60352  ORF Transcript_25090/g.60352 Transcript_25090/m.60352 type:complete len:376 (+) Transcript_25090:131-1258(+)|eukprot:CAMPEP_0114488004 /NCGR_PEP_ID=MMETSP0109-20121206/1083_1 /TAXON_ID=29199 /ORGANISM="Chlorarachnion reptans, Strain CCCM449" /LENGTH=375 /DNA_ID=CAMNT_0001664337 /DNA_START=127 /DNA_END=1254 /DNA_ORIENTATION=-